MQFPMPLPSLSELPKQQGVAVVAVAEQQKHPTRRYFAQSSRFVAYALARVSTHIAAPLLCCSVCFIDTVCRSTTPAHCRRCSCP